MRSLQQLKHMTTGENKMSNIENLLGKLIQQQKSTAWNLNRIANTLEDVTRIASSEQNIKHHLGDAVGKDVDGKLKKF